MLQSGIKTLGILADNHQIDIGIARGNVRQIAHGTEIRIQLELLAQLHVDAGEPTANRRGDRTFESHPCALDRRSELFGDVLFVFFKRFGAGLNRFPFKLQTSGFKNTNYCLSYFCTDAVPGN